MNTKLMRVTLLFIGISASISTIGYTQETNDAKLDSAFVEWADSHVIDIDTDNLSPINPVIGNAKVVALGEPAHGFHEMLSFRNAMFKYLVEKKDFTAIVLEADFAKSRIVNDFINGDLNNVLEAAQSLTIGKPSIENVELIGWMRHYNLQPSHKKKLSFYGMDIQMVGFPGDTVPSHPAIDAVLDYLKKVDYSTSKRFKNKLAPFLPRISVNNYVKLTQIENELLHKVLNDLINIFTKHKSAYIKASTKREYEWTLHAAVVARQTNAMIRVSPPDVPGKIPLDAWQAMTSRDSSMAENVRWISGREDKIFMYAHNAHIKNAPTTGGNWDMLQRAPKSTGQFLKNFFDSKLVIFGISVPSTYGVTQPNSLEKALSKMARQSFLLNLKSNDINQETAKWLGAVRPMQANMVSFINLRVSTAFDAIVYFDKVTTAKAAIE